MENLRKLLKRDKIEINFNKNPIPMDLFLSFLTIQTVRSTDHLGSSNGWTMRVNESYKLIIGGGIYNGTNWLDTIQYGIKLSNPYNNYVNPFYLFDIMTDEGKEFFINYYKEDIEKIIQDKINSIQFLKSKTEKEIDELEVIRKELK